MLCRGIFTLVFRRTRGEIRRKRTAERKWHYVPRYVCTKIPLLSIAKYAHLSLKSEASLTWCLWSKFLGSHLTLCHQPSAHWNLHQNFAHSRPSPLDHATFPKHFSLYFSTFVSWCALSVSALILPTQDIAPLMMRPLLDKEIESTDRSIKCSCPMLAGPGWMTRYK